MDIIKKAFPLVTIIMMQLLILVVLNVSFNIPSSTFSTGTVASLLLPINVLFILLTLTSLLVISNTIKNMEQEIENHVRLESLEQLKDLLQIMRGQRHDFNHHLQTVYGFLSVEAYEEAKNYLEESLSEISVTNEMIKSDNPELNALIYVKSGKMERHGIEFLVDIRTLAQLLPLKTSELNTVVGNLLDNAAEKLSTTPVEHPVVKLEVYHKDALFVLAVTDNGPMIPPSHRDKLFTPGFTTKQGGEGMGLFNIKNVLNKYNGEIQVGSEEEKTTFVVSLPLKKESQNEHH